MLDSRQECWCYSIRGEGAGLQAERVSVDNMVQRRTQAAMVVVFNRYEAESLQHAVRHFSHRAENFGHAVNRPGLRLEGNFDEVALGQGLGQTEQASRDGNCLEVGFCAAAIFEPDRSQNRIA